MKHIEIGKFRSVNKMTAIIDYEDFDRVNQFNWYPHKGSNGSWRAVSYLNGAIKRGNSAMEMSNFVMNFSSNRSIMIDHVNGNSLDNRKSNLSIATRSQNKQNSKKQLNSLMSKFVGVGKYKCLWISRIQFNGKRIYIGSFDSEILAAQAYDIAAIELFGEFARTNFSKENYKKKDE